MNINLTTKCCHRRPLRQNWITEGQQVNHRKVGSNKIASHLIIIMIKVVTGNFILSNSLLNILVNQTILKNSFNVISILIIWVYLCTLLWDVCFLSMTISNWYTYLILKSGFDSRVILDKYTIGTTRYTYKNLLNFLLLTILIRLL